MLKNSSHASRHAADYTIFFSSLFKNKHSVICLAVEYTLKVSNASARTKSNKPF